MTVRNGSVVLPLAQAAAPVALIVSGIISLMVVGFLPSTFLHELMHDGRHLLAFPCH